jgi:hypothetical protein
VQPFAGAPPQYPLPPGQIPVIMGAPPGALPEKKNTLLYVVIGAAVLYGLYSIGTHNQNQNPGTAPTPQTQPGGQQPGGGGGGGSQAVVQAQQFTGHYAAANGYIQISQGEWLNGSNVPLAAAELGCVQVDANGQNLTQNQATLPGPAQPGQTVAIPTFQLGAEAQGVAKVNCAITAVAAAN